MKLHGKATDADKLVRALEPFVVAYLKAAEPVGDSDLYNEQPRSVSVTLGDCRRATSVLMNINSGELAGALRKVMK